MVLKFLADNWVNFCLVIVGSFAMAIYILQERRKKIEAASLVKMQIDELQDRLREFSTYIVEKQINASAFYESLPLMEENYWNKYKHFFVKSMDQKSFSDINLFYSYASEIQEQQLLLKQIQKDSFSLTQKAIVDIQTQLISCGMNNQNAVVHQQFVAAMDASIPENVSGDIRNTQNAFSQQIATQNSNFDMQQFWTNYNHKKQMLELIINQRALTDYVPVQIRISMEKKLREYSMLNVPGSLGYQMLCELSKKRF